MKSRPAPRKTPYFTAFVVAIMLTAASGWLLTDFLGRVAEREFKDKADRDAILISFFLHDKLNEVISAAKSLGPADAIVEALSSGSSADLERANKLLDRINNNFEMSVCYLLDRNGLAVASSNRNVKNGFVGTSFANRPYFTGAVAGRLTTYFALGKITRERGYFASIPVIDSGGTITGVVVVKTNVAPVEDFIKKYSHVYLVSPDGIIFISSREELLYRSLWPVAERNRTRLLASGQFGSISFEPLLATEPRTGTYVRFEEKLHYLQRLPFGSDGWMLVLMDDPRIVSSYRLFGIVLTVVFSLLLMFFFNLLLYKNRSLETARDLLKSRDDWKQTFDTVPDLIVIIDPNYRITSMNRAMAERLGISPQEAVGRRCYEVLHGAEEPHCFCPHQKMLVSGNIESESTFQKNLNGYFIVTAAPILAENGTIESSILVMHDITEMKQLSEEVNMIHNLESIGLLAGGLAHDFNNVLNIIYGNITFVKMLAGDKSAFVEPLNDAEEACERAKELGSRLQVLSQGSSPVKELIALAAIVEDAAGALFNGSDISHTITSADDVLPVEADPRLIRQVCENLLSNANEAMSESGAITITIKNYVINGNSALPLGSGRYVCMTFQDDGKGIPEENLPKIFDPYFSTKDTYSQRGMGLGLSICHAILKRHGGHISVESTVGVGTGVTMYLPAAVADTTLTSKG